MHTKYFKYSKYVKNKNLCKHIKEIKIHQTSWKRKKAAKAYKSVKTVNLLYRNDYKHLFRSTQITKCKVIKYLKLQTNNTILLRYLNIKNQNYIL